MNTNQEITGGLKDNGRSLVVLAVFVALVVIPSVAFYATFTWLRPGPPHPEPYHLIIAACGFLFVAGYILNSVTYRFCCKDNVIEFVPVLGPKKSKKISDIKKVTQLGDRYRANKPYSRVIVFNLLNVFAFDFDGSVMDGSNELFEHLKTAVPEERWKL